MPQAAGRLPSVHLYLVREKFSPDAMFVQFMLEYHHIFRTTAAPLNHSDHFTLLEYLLHILLHEQHI